MSSNNFMYRTMFLLSDTLHQSPPQFIRPVTSPLKKSPGSYMSTCDKGYRCEGPNAVLCGNGTGLMFPLPDSKNLNTKLLMPYSSVQLPETDGFILKKESSVISGSLSTISTNSDQRLACPDNGELLQNSLENNPSSAKIVKERPHTCEDCGKTFLLKHHLVTHTRVHSGERPHVCVHCGKSFAHKHCLSTHLLLHTSDRPYTCPECNKSFTLKHHLVTHARVHNRIRPFVCHVCGRSFPQKRHLVTHCKFHSGERPYVCPECGESFAQEDHLVMHSRFHGGQRPYHCHDCGVSFARKFELVNHGRIHGRVPHSCAVCGKEFLQKRTLQAHSRLHTAAEGSEHPFSCIHCGEAFTTKAALVAHSCGDKEKKYVAREPGNGFSSREGLSLHLRLHAGDHSFVPDLCSLAAAFQHQQPGMGPVFGSSQSSANDAQSGASAENAGRIAGLPDSQAQDSTVRQHTAQSHSVVPKAFPPNLKPKPHVCQDCGRAFSQKHGLQQHNKRYTNGGCDIRRFACVQCGKAFLQKNHLVLHERQHLGPQERNSGAQSRAQVQAQQMSVSECTQQNLVQQNSPPVTQTALVGKPDDDLALHEQRQQYLEHLPVTSDTSSEMNEVDHKDLNTCHSASSPIA